MYCGPVFFACTSYEKGRGMLRLKVRDQLCPVRGTAVVLTAETVCNMLLAI
jgi:hypothetical protein